MIKLNTVSIIELWRNPEIYPSWTLKDWETILGQASFCGLAGKLAVHFEDRGWLKYIPDKPGGYLESWLRLVDRQQHEIRWETDAISRAVKNTGAPIILLKGAAYLMSGLQNSRGRLFSDIDIMTPRSRLHDVESALFKNGWVSEERDTYNIHYYRQWMHEIPPMRHVQRNTVIDLHHTITAPTSVFRIEVERLLEKLIPIDSDRNLYTLSPADMVLHCAVHLFQEGEFNHGLRDLLDLHEILQHFGKEAGFDDELLNRARELNLSVPLQHALVHINRLFESGNYDYAGRILEKAEFPKSVTSHIMYWLLCHTLKPHHPSCDQPFDNLARFILYVRSHYLRMPIHLLTVHLVRKALKGKKH